MAAGFAARYRADFERWLADLVNIPSVSVDPAHAADVRRCAETALRRLQAAGAGSAELIETGGHPLVYARLTDEPGWPTVTVYNHLDVQPADGDDWRTDPFQLSVQGDRYIGRGATDDKGPALAALLGALAAREAGVPLNVAFIWELEEEIGSPSFETAIRAHAKEFATDTVVVSDTVWVSRARPAAPAG
ncbi:MAG TPA: M20/M25/M40 family metallo-hydrolase, partial [Chloroflexota bacterium]